VTDPRACAARTGRRPRSSWPRPSRLSVW